jgi:inosose dehydratase
MTWKSDFPRALQETQQLGFRACEPALRFVREYAGDAEKFRARLRTHSLAMSALYESYSFTERDASAEAAVKVYTQVAQLVRVCGGDVVVVGPGMTRSRGLSPPTAAGLRQAARIMTEVADRCADLGVKACLHPHLWSEIQDEREILAVMDEAGDALLLCPDTAHLGGAGVDPIGLVRRYSGRIGHVHLKDLTIGGDLEHNPDATATAGPLPFCELGKGSVNLKGFVECLRDIGYNGWATVELDYSDNPYQSLAICRDYLLSEVGLLLGAQIAQRGADGEARA